MGLRETMNQNNAVVATVAVLLIVVALLAMWKFGGSDEPTLFKGGVYFYDANTGKVITKPAETLPPADAPSGPLQGTPDEPAAMRAYVYSCGSCSEDQWFIAYLGKLPEKVKKMLQAEFDERGKLSLGSFSQMTLAQVVAAVPGSPDDKLQWLSANSPAGLVLLNRTGGPCPDGSKPSPCKP